MGWLKDLLTEIQEILDITLFNKWLWIIIVAMVSIVVLPFFVMAVILSVPSWLSTTITVLVIVGWAVAGGYKDWSLHKRKQEKAKFAGQEVIPFNYERFSEKDEEYD
jgi:hypothetical protein